LRPGCGAAVFRHLLVSVQRVFRVQRPAHAGRILHQFAVAVELVDFVFVARQDADHGVPCERKAGNGLAQAASMPQGARIAATSGRAPPPTPVP
jgi:hypothetical protein